MSEERFQELESKLTVLDRIVVVGWSLLVGGFGIGGWVASLEIRARDLAERAAVTGTQVNELSHWKSETNGNRYTSLDAANNIRATQEAFNAHDRRIQRVEDNIQAIQKALDRIENKIGSK